MPTRTSYPTDVSDDEWEFAAPYLTLLPLDAGQRRYDLREVFNAVRWIVRAGAPWSLLPHEFPPWPIVYQQARRWLDHGCCEALAHDLRAAAGGGRQQHAAVGGHLRRPRAAIEPRELRVRRLQRAQAAQGLQRPCRRRHPGQLARAGRHARQPGRAHAGGSPGARGPGSHLRAGRAGRGWTKGMPARRWPRSPPPRGSAFQVVKLPEAKHGFVLLPRRWVPGGVAWWRQRLGGAGLGRDMRAVAMSGGASGGAGRHDLTR